MLENFLKSAIRGEKIIAIKYYPNKDGYSHRAWRFIEALYMFTRKRKRYVLVWQETGTTGSGYRLMFVENIQDWKSVDTKGNLLFKAPPLSYVETEFLAIKMFANSEVE